MDSEAKIFHDRLEATPLAKAPADGTVDLKTYRLYLRTSLEVWESLEATFDLARELKVAQRLREDLALINPDTYEDESVPFKAVWQAQTANRGDLYVLGLGLCFGGSQMRKNLREKTNLPVRHMRMPKGSVDKLRALKPNSSEIVSAFSKTLAWYSHVS